MLRNKKKIAITAAVLAIAAVAATGGIVAYFNDADVKVNTFTIGEVSLDLQEPLWDALPDENNNNIPDDAEKMVVLDVFGKDPRIINDGINNEYVFMTIGVPIYSEKNIADINTGKKSLSNKGEIFDYLVGSTYYSTLEQAVANNRKFTVIGYSVGDTQLDDVIAADGETAYDAMLRTAIETNAGYLTYHIAYAVGDNVSDASSVNPKEQLVSLAPGIDTVAVFSSVRVKNFVEDGWLAGRVYEMPIDAYGIQTDNIPESVTTSQQVFNIIKTQAPVMDDKT